MAAPAEVRSCTSSFRSGLTENYKVAPHNLPNTHEELLEYFDGKEVNPNKVIYVAGNNNPMLAEEIGRITGFETHFPLRQFGSGDYQARIGRSAGTSLEGKHLIIFQAGYPDPNDSIASASAMADAGFNGHTKIISAFFSAFPYARADKVEEPGSSGMVRWAANTLAGAGVNHLYSVHPHAQQSRLAAKIPWDFIGTIPTMLPYLDNWGIEPNNTVVVGPDISSKKLADLYTAAINCGDGESAAINKKRKQDKMDEVEVAELIGKVSGKKAILPDDESASGETINKGAMLALEKGATEAYAIISHPIFTRDKIDPKHRRYSEKIADGDSPLAGLLRTNGVVYKDEELNPAGANKIITASLAPAIAVEIYQTALNWQ